MTQGTVERSGVRRITYNGGRPTPGHRSRGLGCPAAVGWLVMAALFGVLVRVHPITAAEFTCVAGDVACLTAAIHAANATGEVDTITLAAGTYALSDVDNTTDGLNGLPSITSPLTIVGADSGTTILELKADVGGFRLIHIGPSGHLTLERLIIRRGDIYTTFEEAIGGALYNRGTTVILNTTLTQNRATQCIPLCHYGQGGAIANMGRLPADRSARAAAGRAV